MLGAFTPLQVFQLLLRTPAKVGRVVEVDLVGILQLRRRIS